MSARKSIHAITDIPCYGGASPNAYVPKITCEVRLHYPPNTVTEGDVLTALYYAHEEALGKVRTFFAERDGCQP